MNSAYVIEEGSFECYRICNIDKNVVSFEIPYEIYEEVGNQHRFATFRAQCSHKRGNICDDCIESKTALREAGLFLEERCREYDQQ